MKIYEKCIHCNINAFVYQIQQKTRDYFFSSPFSRGNKSADGCGHELHRTQGGAAALLLNERKRRGEQVACGEHKCNRNTAVAPTAFYSSIQWK